MLSIDEIAKGLKLDLAKFKADMDGDDCKARVNGDMQGDVEVHLAPYY